MDFKSLVKFMYIITCCMMVKATSLNAKVHFSTTGHLPYVSPRSPARKNCDGLSQWRRVYTPGSQVQFFSQQSRQTKSMTRITGSHQPQPLRSNRAGSAARCPAILVGGRGGTFSASHPRRHSWSRLRWRGHLW